MAKKSVAAVLLAAGASQRMGENKLAMRFGGKTPLELCLKAFGACRTRFERIVIAVGGQTRELAERLVQEGVSIVQGGATRGESVLNALRELEGCDVVAIHDAARCLVTPEVIDRAVDSAIKYGSGVAGVYSKDTLRLNGKLIPREAVFAAQTPQAFDYRQIMGAYLKAMKQGVSATDDCQIFAIAGHEPRFVEGSSANLKLTTREDVALFSALLGRMRTGYGEDTHRLVQGRKLVLGGVEIPFGLGLEGHSDADALTHAVIDALLGSAALGDIGSHFPDTEEEYRGICSLELLKRVGALLQGAGYAVGNIDATVVAQAPRLLPYIGAMRKNIAGALGLDVEQVSVKATTPEHTGPEGRLECITARCACGIRSA